MYIITVVLSRYVLDVFFYFKMFNPFIFFSFSVVYKIV